MKKHHYENDHTEENEKSIYEYREKSGLSANRNGALKDHIWRYILFHSFGTLIGAGIALLAFLPLQFFRKSLFFHICVIASITAGMVTSMKTDKLKFKEALITNLHVLFSITLITDILIAGLILLFLKKL